MIGTPINGERIMMGPTSAPAMPASAEPIANVAITTMSVLIPTSVAASASSATARIDLPRAVF
jgi:hypothetical protein